MNGKSLSLAIADNLINVHLGGYIHCRNSLNQGIRVKIEMPIDN